MEWKQFYKIKRVLKRAQTEKSFWKGLKSTQILKTKFIYFIIIFLKIFDVKDFKSRDFETLLVF